MSIPTSASSTAGAAFEALVDRAKAVGCKSLAITDHNGLYGAVRFYDYAKKTGVKPIVGVELDLEGIGNREQGIEGKGPHLVLLAKNLNGYSNLCKIITRAQLSHEKGEAAASVEVINEHRDDLFCLSGCPSG